MTTYQTASSYKCTAQPVAAHTELTFNPHTLREYSTDVMLYSTNITTLMLRTKTFIKIKVVLTSSSLQTSSIKHSRSGHFLNLQNVKSSSNYD